MGYFSLISNYHLNPFEDAQSSSDRFKYLVAKLRYNYRFILYSLCVCINRHPCGFMARILDTVFLGASPWQNGPPDLFSDLLQDWHDRLALPFVLEIVLPFRMAKSPPILVADLCSSSSCEFSNNWFVEKPTALTNSLFHPGWWIWAWAVASTCTERTGSPEQLPHSRRACAVSVWGEKRVIILFVIPYRSLVWRSWFINLYIYIYMFINIYITCLYIYAYIYLYTCVYIYIHVKLHVYIIQICM